MVQKMVWPVDRGHLFVSATATGLLEAIEVHLPRGDQRPSRYNAVQGMTTIDKVHQGARRYMEVHGGEWRNKDVLRSNI